MDNTEKITKNYKLVGTESDPVIIAQRLLNLYRQLHIFSPDKKEAYNKMLLEQTPEVKKILGTLPGGIVVQQYLSELEGEAPDLNGSDENLDTDPKSPLKNHTNEQVNVQPTVVSVANDPQMIKGIVDAFKEAIITSEKNRKEDTKELAQTIVALQSKVMQEMMAKMSNNAAMSAASASKVETKVTTVETKVVNAEAATNTSNFPVGQLEDIVAGISRAQSELIKEMAHTQTEQLSQLISKVLKEIQQMSTQTLIDAVQTVHRENMDFFKNQIFSSVSKVPMEANIAEQNQKEGTNYSEVYSKKDKEKPSDSFVKKIKFPWGRTEEAQVPQEEASDKEKIIQTQDVVEEKQPEIASVATQEEQKFEEIKNIPPKQPEIKMFKFPWETEETTENIDSVEISKNSDNELLQSSKDDIKTTEEELAEPVSVGEQEKQDFNESNNQPQKQPEIKLFKFPWETEETTENETSETKNNELPDVTKDEEYSDETLVSADDETQKTTERQEDKDASIEQYEEQNQQVDVKYDEKPDDEKKIEIPEVEEPEQISYTENYNEENINTENIEKSFEKEELQDIAEPVDLDEPIDFGFSLEKKDTENGNEGELKYVEEEEPVASEEEQIPAEEATEDNGDYEWEYVEEEEPIASEEEQTPTEEASEDNGDYEWEYVEEEEPAVTEEEQAPAEEVAEDNGDYEWEYVEEEEPVASEEDQAPAEEASEDNGDYEWEYVEDDVDTEQDNDKNEKNKAAINVVDEETTDEEDPYNPMSEETTENAENSLLVNNNFVIQTEDSENDEIVLDENFGLSSSEDSSQPT